ncbi:MAG: transcription elongation factor GreA, partial [Clostridia bacterium]|nr:transcription elongation factor GreA [Clostridia bacterium]
NLKVTKRPEIAEKIKEAREFGDLSENSEYEAAINEQAMIESRIRYIEEQLKIATVLNHSELSTDIVSVGSIVSVYDFDFKEDTIFTIVGKTESDPENNKVSDQSPIGKALMGQSKGAIVEVAAPGGAFKLEIKDISLPKSE